jgi:zinc transport system permease protein
MQRAIIAALLISAALPLVGNIVVLRRLSPVGDALSHGSLFGVALGLCFGVNPVLGAVLATLFSAFLLEFIRGAFPKYSEISTSIIMSLGVGLAAVLSGFVKSRADFDAVLFGSVVAVSDIELVFIFLVSVSIALYIFFNLNELLYMAFDEESAAVSGVNCKRVNFIFTFLLALAVSISAKTVGALLISTLMVIPPACAMQLSKSFKGNIILSVAFGMFFALTGLLVSALFDLKPGGVISVTGVLTLIVIILIRRGRKI